MTTSAKSAVLLTGASSGIGYALAELFAQARRPVVLVARE